MEKGLKNIQNLKEPQYFKTWFLRIVMNEAKNIISKNKKLIYLEDVEKYNNLSEKELDKILNKSLIEVTYLPINTYT